jgi:hypothetical protein
MSVQGYRKHYKLAGKSYPVPRDLYIRYTTSTDKDKVVARARKKVHEITGLMPKVWAELCVGEPGIAGIHADPPKAVDPALVIRQWARRTTRKNTVQQLIAARIAKKRL